MDSTIHLVIKGKVQGVFYRATAKQTAKKYGITGWIRNTEEGNVEALVSGDKRSLDQFIDWCKKGPSNAKVDEVTVSQRGFAGFNTFEIRN
jgi:acylphosphatase